MSDLLKEFEQDIRRERMDQLWHKFGRMMVGASIAVVAATVVYVLWQNHAEGKAMEQTSALLMAGEKLNAGKYPEAIEAFDALAKNGDAGHAGLALLKKAQAQAAAGDGEASKATYRELSARNDVYGALAKLNTGESETPERDEAFYYARAEQHAWGLLAEGKKDEAVALMSMLRDDKETPRSQQNRLMQMLSHMAPESAAPQAEPKE